MIPPMLPPPSRACRPSDFRVPGCVRGFSLIELSVVLVLLTIVLGLGLGALNAQFQSASATVTKKRQELIREALIAHLGAAKRLPCADDPTVGGVNGVENCEATFGIVPYATLGLARESAEDGWGNLFSYAVYADAAPTCPGSGKDWKNAACFGEGKSGGFTINDGTVSAATAVTTGAIAVIVSHGANGLGAWTREATRNVSPTACEEAHNSQQAACTLVANTFYRGERADVDDVVAYLNASEAIAELARQGAVKSAPARMTEDMQAAIDTVLGAIATNGCTAGYSITLPTQYDPWGTAYTSSTVTPSISPVYQISSSGCTGTTCAPQVAATTRQLLKGVVDGYRSKRGQPPC